MSTDYLIRQHTMETELDLFLGNSAYQSGACARDLPTQIQRPVERLVLEKVRMNRLTGEILPQ